MPVTQAEVEWPDKAPVVGTPISMTSYREILSLIDRRPMDQATAIAICNVHSVMTARRNPALAKALANAAIATPDGMPLVWVLRSTHAPKQQRVSGPNLMRAALQYGVSRGWKHYFFGTTPETLVALRSAAERTAPGVQIVGAHAPPFRPLDAQEEAKVVSAIEDSGADLVWVATGMPKQELFMAQVADRLPGVALIGVGAAFDLLSGRIREAPRWMQSSGLEWVYRLRMEPRRLWRRYAVNNPRFIVLAVRQVITFHVARVGAFR